MQKFVIKAGLGFLALSMIVHIVTSSGHRLAFPYPPSPAAVAQAPPASSPAPGGSQVFGTPDTRDLWARAFLKLAGYKRTLCNRGAIIGWENEENTPQSWKNPLADTLRKPGSVVENSDGVRKYRRWIDGLEAAAFTLTFHPAIERALRAGDNAQAVADAVQQPSTSGHMWGTAPFQASCLTG